MPKYKFLVFLAVWKRPEITELCFMGLERLRKIVDLQVVAVISEGRMIPLCKRYGIDWCMTYNNPLGAKKNYGLTYAMGKDFDFMIEIGSDDLLKNEFFDVYQWDKDVMCLADFISMNSEDGECRRLSDRDGKFGLGRAISKDALVAMGGMIWNQDQVHGLDNFSTFALARKGYLEKRFKSVEPVAIDVKSEVNIWPFRRIGQPYDYAKAISGLSYREVCALKNLRKYATV
jgi:hypothetical protein